MQTDPNGLKMIPELTRVRFGDSFLPESWIYAGGSKEKQVPIIFSIFLIRTGERMILVDAGCVTMDGFDMRNFIGPVKALSGLGVLPEQITDVIITHAHHDHIECVGDFPNALIHIHADGLGEGRKYIPAAARVHAFQEAFALEDGLRVVPIGGHAPGSSVVEVDMGGKTRVLCGDECYSFYNLKYRVPTATSFCPEKSRAFIEKYTSGDYECLLCHEL